MDRRQDLSARLENFRAQCQQAAEEVSRIQGRRREITSALLQHEAMIERLQKEITEYRRELHELGRQEPQMKSRVRALAANALAVERWLADATLDSLQADERPQSLMDCQCGGTNPRCMHCGGLGMVERRRR